MTPVKIPSVGESITEVVISTWLKKDGDYVEADDSLAEVESDKATVELPAPVSGVLKLIAKEGDTIAIGEVACEIDETQKGSAAKPKEAKKEDSSPPPTPQAESKTSSDGHASGHPSPAAKKILEEKDIDPKNISGSGMGGRITKEDALNAKKMSVEKKSEQPKTTTTLPKGERESERKKMTPLRKTIARRLVEAKNTTAMLTTFNEIDMSAANDLRKKYKEPFKEKYGVNLGFMSLFTKACVHALQSFPSVNAYIDGDEMILHHYCDIGIAVSTPKGLVVPVVRNCENLGLHEIELGIRDLALRGRDGKLSIDEMQGGTFTITNGGVFGSMLSTPILNIPQSAILGMHNIVDRPVVKNGQIVIAPVMYVALSYDHRIVDGKESVSFLKTVKEMIEDPTRLLIGV